MRIKRLFGLKYFLFIFVFTIVFIIVMSLGLVYYKNFEAVTIANSSFFFRNAISYSARELDVKLRTVENLAVSISGDTDIIQGLLDYGPDSDFYELFTYQQKIFKKLSLVTASYPYISNINILTLQDAAKSTAYKDGYINIGSITDMQVLDELADNPQGWICSRKNFLMLSDLYETDTICYYKRIYASLNGPVIGYVLINLKESYFYDIIKSGFDRFDTDIYIIDNKGVIITDLKQKLGGKDFYSLGLISGKDLEANSGTLVNSMSKQYFICSSVSDVAGWTVVSITPTQELLNDFNGIQQKVLIIGLLILITSIIVIIFLTQFITSPIHRLAGLMSNFEKPKKVRIPFGFINEIDTLYSSYNQMNNRIEELLRQLREEEDNKRKAELVALQAQINPHFLHNTLESVNWLALAAHQKDISTMVCKLSRIMRLSLNKGRNFYRIRDELEHIRSYLDIQRYRYSNSFKVEENVDETVLDHAMLKLILQPIVENALVHGFNKTSGAGTITISIQRDNANICFMITDNGCGMSREEIDLVFSEEFSSEGYGIKNVNQRIKLYFGQEYGLEYSSRPGEGTAVKVVIPARVYSSDIEDKRSDGIA